MVQLGGGNPAKRLVSGSGDFTVRIWEPVPVRTRVQARENRKQSMTRVAPMVEQLFEKMKDTARVAERINADQSLSPLDRRTALQIVIRRGLEAHTMPGLSQPQTSEAPR